MSDKNVFINYSAIKYNADHLQIDYNDTGVYGFVAVHRDMNTHTTGDRPAVQFSEYAASITRFLHVT